MIFKSEYVAAFISVFRRFLLAPTGLPKALAFMRVSVNSSISNLENMSDFV